MTEELVEFTANLFLRLLRNTTVARRLPRENNYVVSVIHDCVRRALVCDCVRIVIGRKYLIVVFEVLHRVDGDADPLRSTWRALVEVSLEKL